MFETRLAKIGDAPELASLLKELGYDVATETIATKLGALTGTDRIVVATDDGRVIACIGCHSFELLQAPSRLGRITTLVVASAYRRRGVGAQLLREAEDYLRSVGCDLIELTSREQRVDAHAFYAALGYSERRKRFTKPL